MREISRENHCTLDLPDTLKKMSRIFEKVLLNDENPGSCNKITDIVRAMFTTTSMSQVAHIANTFVACDAIVIVRVKDRFVEKPSPGGWRDLMINFYMADDPNQHICEVQIVSSKLLVARKGLKENINYARTRNALEILERLDAKDPAKRWSRARYLRDVEKVSAGSLFSLGYEVFDLLKAGYSEEDFKDAIGLDDKDLKAAREQLVEECLNRADILAMAQGGSKSGKSGRFGGSAKSSRLGAVKTRGGLAKAKAAGGSQSFTKGAGLLASSPAFFGKPLGRSSASSPSSPKRSIERSDSSERTTRLSDGELGGSDSVSESLPPVLGVSLRPRSTTISAEDREVRGEVWVQKKGTGARVAALEPRGGGKVTPSLEASAPSAPSDLTYRATELDP